jgi:MYXO-CTERM domain-containing protein
MDRIASGALLVLWLLGAGPARADLCLFDAKQDGTGANVRWMTAPIGYQVNVARLPAAQQAPALAAIQAAFATWELSCTSLKFQYLGASTSTTEVAGAILVYFGNDAASWPYGSSAYYYSLNWQSLSGDVSKASIGMNARDYLWSVGAVPSSIDIQSAVTQMLPGALGFYVGSDPKTGSVAIGFNTLNRTLTQEHLDGARYLYFQAGPGCSQPAKPKACAATVPADGGPPADAGSKDGVAKLDGGASVGDAAKDSANKDGASKDGASKDGAGKDAGQDGAGKDGAGKDGTIGEGAPSLDGARIEAATRDGTPADALVGEGGRLDVQGWPIGGEARPAPPLGDKGCNCGVAASPRGWHGLLALALALALLCVLRRRS